MKTSWKVLNLKVHRVYSYCLSKERVDSESLNESFLKRIPSRFMLMSTWNIGCVTCVWKPRQLTCSLDALWGNDFAGSVFARRHLMKLISDRLLRQHNGLMIYNKIERVLVITKQICNCNHTDFSLTSKVQKVSQKYTFTHKLATKHNFQTPSFFV